MVLHITYREGIPALLRLTESIDAKIVLTKSINATGVNKDCYLQDWAN